MSGRHATGPRWPAGLAVLAAIALYASLPSGLILGPWFVRYLVPALALAVLVPLAVTAPHRHIEESRIRRRAAMTLTGLISAANVVALGYLIDELLYKRSLAGRPLLYGAFSIWATNVIAFALWYWEPTAAALRAALRTRRRRATSRSCR